MLIATQYMTFDWKKRVVSVQLVALIIAIIAFEGILGTFVYSAYEFFCFIWYCSYVPFHGVGHCVCGVAHWDDIW